MASQEVQLVQAAEIASNAAAVADANLVSQALAYLEQLKQATEDSWSTGWAVWMAREEGRAKYAHAVRLFGLNLVDDFLDRRYVLSSPFLTQYTHRAKPGRSTGVPPRIHLVLSANRVCERRGRAGRRLHEK